MKKYIIILIVTIGLFTSINSVFARTNLSTKGLNTIIQVMKDFGVEDNKITEIVKILQRDSIEVVKPSPVIQKTNTNGTRCWMYNPCGTSA